MIRAAIVGLGRWGRNLVSAAKGSDKIRFVAGLVRDREKAFEFAHQHGLALFTGWNSLLLEKDVDAVVLATPHSLHAEQIVAAAKAGKHVFCEKPFALTRADAEAAAGDLSAPETH